MDASVVEFEVCLRIYLFIIIEFFHLLIAWVDTMKQSRVCVCVCM